jgi:hypothetical protein
MPVAQQAATTDPIAASLANAADRLRLSAPGFRAFLAAADFLDLSVGERTRLLGDLPPATYHRYVAKGAPGLTRDTLERVSLVLGIVKGLRLIFAEDTAGLRWLRAPNTDAPFDGRSPADFMLQGSVAHLHTVRRYLDAWRESWP